MNTLEFCQKYLKNYYINTDDTIDVDDDVDLWKKLGDMEKLPVKFGKVSGYFDCSMNNLTTLEGCPNYVDGYFSCSENKLTSLEYSPKYIGSSFYCYDNKLTKLEYCPKFIGGGSGCEILTHHILGNVQDKIFYNIQKIVI
jgi:hypothetical protein